MGCCFFLQGIFLIQGLNTRSPALTDRFFTTPPPGKPPVWASLLAQLVKNPPARRPWRRDNLPTPIFQPREFHGLYNPRGCKQSGVKEQISLSLFKHAYMCVCLCVCMCITTPGGSVVKHLPANTGDAGNTGLIPGSGRFPGEEVLKYFCLDNPMERVAWQTSIHGVRKSDTTEWLNTQSCEEVACRAWQPTPVFLPRESHEERSLTGYSPKGCKEIWLKRLITHTHTPTHTYIYGVKYWALCIQGNIKFPDI